MVVSRVFARIYRLRLLGSHARCLPQCFSHSHTSSLTMATYTPVTHVIFDMDGLLLDTVQQYAVIRQQILQEFGYKYDFSNNIRSQGMLGGEVARMIVAEYSLPISAEEFESRAAALREAAFSNVKFMPDTEIIYERIISSIAEKYNCKYTAEVKLRVLGTNEEVTAERVVEGCGLPISAQEFLVQFRKLQLEQLGKCNFMPGAERLIRHLHETKVPIAVATSSGRESVGVKTKNFQEVFQLFHHIVMGSSDPEVKNGKPAPDIFRVCASRFPDQPATHKCLVFEDAPNGVTGAVAAGMQTVMVPDPQLPPERTKDATLVLSSLLEFKPEQFGLPAF